ncbi:DUF47 family protein [Pedobacter sp. B4-66]|uniref:DUF47 domain-containing protein n=1 Tax=Pedobacter sp. B4-66 TaxID=2817280 RepID=UPI001BD982A4|nr:DUF47 family protein [Pedobacter sp. B4-66]
MNSVFNFFSPKDKTFQPLFEQASTNLVLIAETLLVAVNTPDQEKRKQHIKEVERLEQVGDDITHTIFLGLSKTFITPFDREDIHALVSALDDIADYIYASAMNMDLFNIKIISKPMKELAALLVDMCKDLNTAILELRNFKNTRLIAEICLKINKGESTADLICNTALASLFDDEFDAIELIKQKEVLQTMEIASDKCDDVANVLESILIKNA